MKTGSKFVKCLFVLSTLCMFLIPGIVSAGNSMLTVQTAGNASNAAAGESGASISAAALISVVVTDSLGKPVENLGSDIGDGTSEINLPTGWTLATGFNVPPGACLMTPTQFYNAGDGIYVIRVVPYVHGNGCTWLSGTYHYAVSIESKGKKPYTGSGLGELVIE